MICSGLAVFLATVALLCGGNTLACISVITTDGAVALGWLLGATALGALILRRFQLETSRALFIATAGGLGLGIFSLLGLGLGLLGGLNRPIAIAFPGVSILVFVIDLLLRHSTKPIDRGNIEDWLRAPAGFAWLWLVPVVSLAIAAVSASLMPGILWKPLDPHPYDVTSYHLLVPREWYEGGRIVPLSHNVFSYFPFNVEMQFLLLMHATGGPWAGMYACQFVSVGYAALMVLAVYGSGEGRKGEHRTPNVELRTSNEETASSLRRSTFDVQRSMFAFNSTSTIAAGVASAVPWVIMLAGVAYVESGLMLYTALAVAWALHAIANPKHFVRSAIVSGIMAGFACGVKITAVPMLLLAVPVALLLLLLIRKSTEIPAKKILIGCVALAIAGSVVLSPWLIRNFIWSGNPLFPIAMKTLGQDHFTDEQVTRFTSAHSPTPLQHAPAAKLRILAKDVYANWEYGYLLLPAGFVACVLGWRKRETWLLVICGLFVLVVWIGFTHLLPRFLVMLIPIAAIAVGRIEWRRAWPGAIALLLAAAGLGWSFVIPQLCKQSNPPPMFGQQRVALFGPTQLEFMMPQELIDAHNNNPKLQIALIGDAQAFLYQIPMSQMHYRSVFNVATGTDDPIDAWVGPQVRGNPEWFLVINPMEIARLHATYAGIPPLPKQWDPQLDAMQDFFLRGDQVPKK